CLTHGNFCAAKSYSSKVTVAARAMKDLLASPGAGRRHEAGGTPRAQADCCARSLSGRSPQCRLVGSQRFGSLVVCQTRLMMARRAALTAYECQAGGLAAQALMPWLPTSGQKFGHISRRCARRTPEGHLDWRGVKSALEGARETSRAYLKADSARNLLKMAITINLMPPSPGRLCVNLLNGMSC
ncbi:unnamed protein product, partial [Effrenium voratum]